MIYDLSHGCHMLQEKLSSKIEKIEALKIVVEKLRKKIRIIILFVGIFSFVGEKKPGVKFVILFVNFKAHRKNPTF